MRLPSLKLTRRHALPLIAGAVLAVAIGTSFWLCQKLEKNDGGDAQKSSQRLTTNTAADGKQRVFTDSERAAYIQKQLDDLGDGQDIAGPALRLGDQGAAAKSAVDPMIRFCQKSDADLWPLYVALGQIGDPSATICELLSTRITANADPMAFAALAIMQEKGNAAAPLVAKMFEESNGIYNARPGPLARTANDPGWGDPESSDKPTTISFDSAIALLAISPNHPDAPRAVARIARGDPRASWRNGTSEFATLLMQHIYANEKADYWYGVAFLKALASINKNAQLRRILAAALIDGGTTIENYHSYYSDTATEQRAKARQAAHLAQQRKLNDYKPPHSLDGTQFNFAPVAQPNSFDDYMAKMTESSDSREWQMVLVKAQSTRAFICWALRAASYNNWTKPEADFEEALRAMPQSVKEEKNPGEQMLDDPFFIQPARLEDAPDVEAESLGLLQCSDSRCIKFLIDLAQAKGTAVSRGRAALALKQARSPR